MTKIEGTLGLAVIALKAQIDRLSMGKAEPLSSLPSKADLDELREWVTAALPVVEAVREMQYPQVVVGSRRWYEAANKASIIALPVPK